MQQDLYRRYQKVEAMTSSSLTQVAIIFEHCAQLIRHIKKGIADNNIESRFQYSDKAMMILQNLQGAFEVERSQEGKLLHHFCQTIINALIYLNFTPTQETCDQLIEMLLEMSHLWREAEQGMPAPSREVSEQVMVQL